MKTFIALVMLLSCAPLGAHDFWIEPSTYRPARGETFTAALRVGENFEGDPVPRRSSRIESFLVRDADGERPVAGIENRHPAGILRAGGMAVIGYHGKPHTHVLSRAKFEQFLREEGLANVRVKETVRERFHRFAKSVVGGTGSVAPFGFLYELVPEGDAIRVLYEGKPLANAHVTALARDGRRVSERTDREGRVSLNLGPGVWLIKSVHLVPAPKGADYDYDSLWASLTMKREGPASPSS